MSVREGEGKEVSMGEGEAAHPASGGEAACVQSVPVRKTKKYQVEKENGKTTPPVPCHGLACRRFS